MRISGSGSGRPIFVYFVVNESKKLSGFADETRMMKRALER
jgi:hypothetical protein